jgi:hypothetical protein
VIQGGAGEEGEEGEEEALEEELLNPEWDED